MRLLFTLILLASPVLWATTPPLELAKQLTDKHQVERYLASEKYDGIRATWINGELRSRGGLLINTPANFTANWPSMRLDGELWAGRGRFNHVSNTVLDNQPNAQHWQDIRFMVFDAPSDKPFFKRYSDYTHAIAHCDCNNLEAIKQHRFNTRAQLSQWFNELVSQGAEGVILHRRDARFNPGRSDNVLKLKPYMDSEAKVIGYQQGRGKYQGMLGALIVVDKRGKQFKIGTGFSDAERANPPAIGSTITFKYHGYTKNGVPRFASYLRQRKPFN